MLKENANKATSILLTAIPQIGAMDWTGTLHNLKVSRKAEYSLSWGLCVCAHACTNACPKIITFK